MDALAFIRRHGIVLASAKGPVPTLAHAIAGGPIRGSWWAHPKGREIFQAIGAARDSKDVLVCRLVEGKVTFVHRSLWPALVRLADEFPRERLAQVVEAHTASGRHESREVPYPEWVPKAVRATAARLCEEDARKELVAVAAP
ncbi:MAG TPA: hypothetical protein VH040_07525 [Usitatibacter sp.]|nr:hypothetical protein [Usitatibacter sp.]